MGSAPEDEAAFECRVVFRVERTLGSTAAGEGTLVLFAEEAQIRSRDGTIDVFHYREIETIDAADYRIKANFISGATLELSQIGYRFEDCLRELRRLRSELIIKDMLMAESLLKDETSRSLPFFKGTFRRSTAGDTPQKGLGPNVMGLAWSPPEEFEARLHVSGMIIVPTSSDPVRIPYSNIDQVKEEPYALTICEEGGAAYTFSRMGRDLDPFVRYLGRAMKDLTDRAVTLSRELFPAASSQAIPMVANLLREGRAAKRLDIEAISPDLWDQMEKKLEALGLGAAYRVLSSLGLSNRLAIGFKRGLTASLEEQYVWFLAPIGEGCGSSGNVIAMESASGQGTSKATYFFRVMGRAEYSSASRKSYEEAVDRSIRLINRGMIEVNFRREPVYLPDSRLLETRYVKYLQALRLLPSLRSLRERFVGRVMHVTEEQWERDVQDILDFNVKAADDDEKWRRRKADDAGAGDGEAAEELGGM